MDWEQIGKDGYTSEIWNPDNINNEIDKMVFVKNKGDYDAYVRSVFAFEANGYTVDEFKALFHLNINETDWTWEWKEDVVAIPNAEGGTTNYIIAVATYNEILKPGALTEISLSQIALDSIADNEDIAGFGNTYQVLVKSQAIQADGFTDPATALDEGFCEISTLSGDVSIPWDSDSPIKGIDLKTAIHNLNGDATQPITTQVNRIVYALNYEHLDIVNSNDGVLVDVELDVSGWDTSKVTAMGWTFYGCRNLEVIDISNWDVSKVTVMSHMFADCNKVKELKVDNWDVSSLESLDAIFNDCDSLITMNVGNWNTGTIKEFSQSFESCDSLQYIYGLENWNTSNGRIFDEMFNGDYSLKELNLSSFDTRNVTLGHKNVNGDICKGFASTFAGLSSLEKLVLGENFIFAGNGNVQEQYQPHFPAPAAVEGSDGNWYNADTGTAYAPSEIPEGAATYVAVMP